MTQQYIRGELSIRLATLCDGHLATTYCRELRDLRRQVELDPAIELPRLAAEAIEVVDAACWTLLCSGDVAAFDEECREEVSLYEFATCAGLLR